MAKQEKRLTSLRNISVVGLLLNTGGISSISSVDAETKSSWQF